MMSLLNEAIDTLKTSDLKVTERRIRMLETMYNENRYLTAKEVKEILSDDYPGISPDTIYRNLHSFSTMKLLEETEFNGEMFFKANCDVDQHHHHFICTKCGRSIELSMCPVTIFKDEIGGAEITSHRFELFGLCEDCAKERSIS